MKTKTIITVLAVFIVAVILIGEVYMYVPSDHGYGSDVKTNGDDVTYTISSDGSSVYHAILLDDGTYTPVTSVYIYYDESQASSVNENTPIAVGGQQMTQKYYLDQVERVLKYKGISDITVVTANELKKAMIDDISNGISAGKGVIFASGTIPSVIMNDDGSGTMNDWIRKGGSMYWSGNIFARYISDGDSIHESNTASIGLIGTNDFSTDTNSSQSNDTQFRVPYSIESGSSCYSPKLSTIKDYLASGYSDGEYASMTYIKCGVGQICIIGGEFSEPQTRDLGTAVCSGLCWCSRIIDHDNGDMAKSISGTMSTKDLSGNGYLYVYLGEYHCVYGKGYIIKK